MVHVRQATPDDAPEVAALTGELGYPAEVHAIRHRLSRLCVVAEHAVLVACEGARDRKSTRLNSSH